jgi:hypothetical protein
MDRWHEIVPLLEEQHGLVERGQLRGLGLTRNQIGRWVEQRRLEVSAPRVWRLVGAPVTWEQRLTNGLLSLGPASAVSHHAASRWHQFDRAPSDRVEFLVGRYHRNGGIDELVHSSRTFTLRDVVSVRGLRVTSATRTILDLANVEVHPDQLRAAIDSAVRAQLSSPETIRRRLEQIRKKGRTGVRMLDDLLVDSGGHTMLEREFLRLMRIAGLPRPETQVVFSDGQRTIARVDFLYREWDIVVEVSGQLGHTTPTERARDAQRRNELQDLGLRVYEFTWEQVTKHAFRVQSEMRAHLRSAGWPG